MLNISILRVELIAWNLEDRVDFMMDRNVYRPISRASIALLIAVAVSGAPNGPRPVSDPPQGDGGVSSFYIWDHEVPGTPGTLLRQEPLPENLMLVNASRSLRVLYTSTNGIDGKTPVAVSGAIYFPKGQAPPGGWPIIAWAHGTTGIADVCAPSWMPRSQRDTDYLNAWLAQGYAIATTDYEGLGTPGGHPHLIARSEAYSLLDSVRSAQGSFQQLSNSVVIVGQSQEAHAAISAALFIRTYAPEVGLKGTVATGAPGYWPLIPETKAPQMQVPSRTGGGLNAGLTVLYLFRYLALDPAFIASDYLSDGAKPVFEAVRKSCLGDFATVADQNGVTVENALRKNPDVAAAKAAPLQRYPRLKFGQPVFIGTGLADVTILPEAQYNLVMAACYTGSTVEQHYYPGKDHSGTVIASLVDSIPFVTKLLTGQRIAGNCDTVKPPGIRN